MEKKEKNRFFQNIWRNLALLVALIILSYATGVSFYWAILIAIFWALLSLDSSRSAYRILSIAMKTTFILFLINVFLKVFLPQAYQDISKGLILLDQSIASSLPSEAKVKAKSLFSEHKKKASEEFLKTYNELLSDGKIKEAEDSLHAFEERWRFEAKKEEILEVVEKQAEEIEKPASVRTIESSRIIKDSIFARGTYLIDVDGETPFYIKIVSNKVHGRYFLESQNGGYFVVYDNGETVYDEPGKKTIFPYRLEPRFRLKSKENRIVKMIVY